MSLQIQNFFLDLQLKIVFYSIYHQLIQILLLNNIITIFMFHVSCFMFHVSCFMFHVSCVLNESNYHHHQKIVNQIIMSKSCQACNLISIRAINIPFIDNERTKMRFQFVKLMIKHILLIFHYLSYLILSYLIFLLINILYD
jgi:hypothetical protein